MRLKNSFFKPVVVILALCLSLSCFPVGAVGVIKETGDLPSDTFTYWDDASTTEAVRAKGMYDLDRVLTVKDFGGNSLASLTDVSFDSHDNLYVLDSAGSQIIVLDKDYQFVRSYNRIVAQDGTEYDFTGANSIFVSAADKLYICDTEHGRVLISSPTGALLSVLGLPESNLIPEEITRNYRPTAITVDSSNYIYVLADGSYYGAMLYSPNGDFLGFYGANKVLTSITQALQKLWYKLTMTDEKYAQLIRKLPFQFTDLYVDNADFVYTSTGATGWGVQKGQIKRLSPGGADILGANDLSFGMRDGLYKLESVKFSDMQGVAVNDDNFIFTFDVTSGYIFIYNDDCALLNAFGGGSSGNADQYLTPTHLNSIDVNSKDDIVVVDSGKNMLIVYSVNDYGRLVFNADIKTRSGDYEAARPLWLEVLKNDRNSQVAYSGIARTYFASGEYDLAMQYAKDGFDADTYSSAFEYVRRDYLEKNINWLAAIVVFLVIGLLVLRYYKRKNHWVFIKNRELQMLSRVTLHPAEVFADVKQKGYGSVGLGVVLIVLYYVSATIKETASGFLFKSASTSSFNSLLVLVQTMGVVLLWTICNWGVCTLMNGKGKLREIFIVTSYSLVPLIIANIVYTVLSNVFVTGEASFLSIFVTVMQLLTAFILITGMIRIHDYSFGEFVWTSILSVLGILIVIFLMIAVFILIQQTYSFLATIVRELIYR